MLSRDVPNDSALLDVAKRDALPSVYLPRNCIGEESLYMNCGYWYGMPRRYDDACAALVTLMADAARIGSGDTVLDLGFGYGDQTELLLRCYEPKRIVGRNISEYQVAVANWRLRTHPLRERLDLRVGDAVSLDLEDSSVDVVMAVECSAHFHTRDRFLREARRVLKPGGRLVLVDVLRLERALKPVSRLVVKSLIAFWKAPPENLYDLATYGQRVKAAGFAEVETTSIREHVFAPLMQHVAARTELGELPPTMDLSLKGAYQVFTRLQQAFRYAVPLDYGLLTATKPA